jgi:regulator of protease activity HflC (stomatin/prohibitin superfamily)
MFDRLLDFLLASLKAFQFWDVVEAWERGVVLRFGRVSRVADPGLCWLIPFYVETVYTTTVVPDVEKLDAQTLTTKDGRIVTVRAVVTYEVIDPVAALTKVSSVRRSLEDACTGEIGKLVSEVDADDLTESRFWGRLTRACQGRTKEWGVGIVRVQLSDVAICKNLRIWTEGKKE